MRPKGGCFDLRLHIDNKIMNLEEVNLPHGIQPYRVCVHIFFQRGFSIPWDCEWVSVSVHMLKTY